MCAKNRTQFCRFIHLFKNVKWCRLTWATLLSWNTI